MPLFALKSIHGTPIFILPTLVITTSAFILAPENGHCFTIEVINIFKCDSLCSLHHAIGRGCKAVGIIIPFNSLLELRQPIWYLLQALKRINYCWRGECECVFLAYVRSYFKCKWHDTFE